VLRYLRVLRLFWGTSIAAEMEYRANFVIAALASALGLGGAVFSLSLFYRGGHHFDGWPWEASVLVLGVFTVLQGFATTFLVPNLGRIVRHVQEGTLDFVLLKPVDSQLYVSARSLSPWGLTDVVFGLLTIGWAGRALGLDAGDYLLGALPLAFALGTFYALWFMLATLAIWFVKIYNATNVLQGLLDAGRFPMAAYPASFRVFFTFVVPVAFLTTVPAEAMLGRASLETLGWSAAVCALTQGLARWFWRFALRSYTSASS